MSPPINVLIYAEMIIGTYFQIKGIILLFFSKYISNLSIYFLYYSKVIAVL